MRTLDYPGNRVVENYPAHRLSFLAEISPDINAGQLALAANELGPGHFDKVMVTLLLSRKPGLLWCCAASGNRPVLRPSMAL